VRTAEIVDAPGGLVVELVVVVLLGVGGAVSVQYSGMQAAGEAFLEEQLEVVIAVASRSIANIETGAQTVEAVHVRKGAQELVLADGGAGEEALGAEIVVQQRIGGL
jgi:hypothetical protein